MQFFSRVVFFFIQTNSITVIETASKNAKETLATLKMELLEDQE